MLHTSGTTGRAESGALPPGPARGPNAGERRALLARAGRRVRHRVALPPHRRLRQPCRRAGRRCRARPAPPLHGRGLARRWRPSAPRTRSPCRRCSRCSSTPERWRCRRCACCSTARRRSIPTTLRRVLATMPDVGLVNIYGQTEGSPITCLTAADHRRIAEEDETTCWSSVGRRVPRCRAAHRRS